MRYPCFSLTALVFVLLLGLGATTDRAEAQDPETISYQGHVTDDSGTPLDGLHNFSFALYDAESGGNELWSEDHSGVNVDAGHFEVALGSQTSFSSQGVPFDEPYWLEVTVSDGTTEETLDPRTKLESTPYANAAHTLALPATLRADESGSAMKVVNQSGAAAEFRNRTTDDRGYESRVRIGSINTDDFHDNFITGVRVDSAALGFQADSVEVGLHVPNASVDGVEITGTGFNGVYIRDTGVDGVQIHRVGNDGVSISGAGNNGVSTYGAGRHGVSVRGADRHGVFVRDADADGDGVGKAGVFDGDVEVTGELQIGESVGIGTNAPQTQLHVQREVSGGATAANHVAFFENPATSNGDVLALKSNATSPGGAVNFITFKSAGDNIGAIEGNGSGGVEYKSGGGDFAELLPRLRPSEEIEAGDVVGIVGGEVTRKTAGVAQISVVTDRAAVLGNDPGEEARSRYEKVSFVGQVPVTVRGAVAKGDLLVASGAGDGTARAVAASSYDPAADGPVVGEAWEGSSGGTQRVNAVIGHAGETAALRSVVERQQAQIERLQAEAGRVDELEQRLAKLEQDRAAPLAAGSMPVATWLLGSLVLAGGLLVWRRRERRPRESGR